MRTFIVRLQQDADGSGRTGAATARLRGVVDEVATGLRATFRNDQELVAALLAAVGSGPADPSWAGGGRAAREPLSDEPNSFSGEQKHVAD